MISYLKCSQDLVLKLSADDMRLLKWHIDVSYAMHVDMKSHTGGNFSMGRGTIYGKSGKQKLDTKSTTESELVGVDDVLPQVLWTSYFIEKQGFETKGTVVYQDNKSTILLAKNGRKSSSKRTKHINVRYYFVKDRIDKKELTIEYCNTDNMIADYFTKPLQGIKFQTFLKEIMGI